MKFKLNPFNKKNVKVTSKFGKRRFYNFVTKKYESGFHNGIDLVGDGDISSITSGIVISVRNNISGYSEKYPSGNYVKVESNDYIIVYYHLKKGTIKLKKGDLINVGDYIGVMGKTGHATGRHLHLGIKSNDKWLDPLPFLLGEQVFNKKYETFKYIIKKGDTLSSIAFKFNVSIDDLVSINNISNRDLIYAGDTLILPNSVKIIEYIVKSGDSLSEIASKYNTSWRKIYNDNKDIIGTNPNLIKKGQILKIYL